jgi:hypothetical protein
MKIHHLTVAAALASLKSGLAGLSDADVQRRLPLPMIQILAVDLGTDMLPGPPARQAKYGKGWAIHAFPEGCRWPSLK